MGLKDKSPMGMNEDELIKMLNNERNANLIYHNYTRDISELIIEESPIYERIRKIQNRIMRLNFELGESSQEAF
ncbi:hypothetical protein ACNR9Q_15045 [Maribacter sp. X9]|uniref:hypothetical protein n=1 Tax=Maribacter sp. X9 TaxID=3402159 RepID=UPI003AF333E3